jgi:transglutaminase-like putative cysteine protease
MPHMSVSTEKHFLSSGLTGSGWGDWWDTPRPPAPDLPQPVPLGAPFGEPVAINRTTLRVVHMADYSYPDSARHIVTRIRLTPTDIHGWQQLTSHKLHIAPLPYYAPEQTDDFGNRVIEARHEKVDQHLTMAIELNLLTHCAYTQEGASLPTPIAPRTGEKRDAFLEFTSRTTPDNNGEMLRLLKNVQAEVSLEKSPLVFLSALGAQVNRTMQFAAGTTHVGTRAAEAWQQRRGVCQDFSHITLCLLRMAGVPARYVSGFVPGEGVMHAWIEAQLTVSGFDTPVWFAFDPTYNKWVNDNYVSVAVGRDYGDITPTSGTYFGGTNIIRFRNKAEKLNKQIILL